MALRDIGCTLWDAASLRLNDPHGTRSTADSPGINRRVLSALLAVIAALAVAGGARLLAGDGWSETDPGMAVIISDTQIGLLHGDKCNGGRIRVIDSSSIELEAVYDTKDGDQKYCAIGDCGYTLTPDSKLPMTVDPALCTSLLPLDEPIGDREFKLRCYQSTDCFVPVHDARS